MEYATSTRLAVVCGVACIWLSGCASLAKASAGQVGCSPDDVTIVDDSGYFSFGGRSWVAVCHGRRHQCSAISTGRDSSQINCTAEEGSTAGGESPSGDRSGAPPQASEPRRAEVTATFAPATSAVLACFPGASSVEFDVSVGPAGDIYDFRTARPLTAGEQQCLRQVFAQGHAPPGPSAVGLRLRFPDEQPSAAPVESSPPVASPDTTAPLRAVLDAQRDAVLACAERPTVVVTARWDATGTVTIALGGDLANTPAEGCVRSAVGAQHVPAGAAGEARHFVR